MYDYVVEALFFACGINYSCLLETMVTLESVGDNTNTGGSAVAGVVTSNFIPTTFP